MGIGDSITSGLASIGDAFRVGGGGNAMATKTVTIDGVSYQVPEGFDESILSDELGIEKQMVESLKGEEAVAQAAIGDIEKQEGKAVKSLRRGAASALATQRGLIEGGRGLAMARGTAESAATKEGVMRSGFASQLTDAKAKAAAAKTQSLAEQGKLLSAKKGRLAETATAQADINATIVDFEGNVYTSSHDYKKMAEALEAKAASATNPIVAQMYAAAAGKARSGTLKTGALAN